eukprot:2821210-Rhodomonas_salina.2
MPRKGVGGCGESLPVSSFRAFKPDGSMALVGPNTTLRTVRVVGTWALRVTDHAWLGIGAVLPFWKMQASWKQNAQCQYRLPLTTHVA